MEDDNNQIIKVDANTILLDSCSNLHCVNDLRYFFEFKAEVSATNVYGSGRSVTLGRGSVILTLGSERFLLKDVAYSPKGPVNIIARNIFWATYGGNFYMDKVGNDCYITANGKWKGIFATVDSFTKLPVISGQFLTNDENWVFQFPQLRETIMFIDTEIQSSRGTKIWHARLGHISINTIQTMLSKETADGISADTKADIADHGCIGCAIGKMDHRQVPRSGGTRATRPLALIHSDLIIYNRNPGLNGFRYVLTFIDDYTKFATAHLLRTKTAEEVSGAVNSFIRLANSRFSPYRVTVWRTDNGTEFFNEPMNAITAYLGVEHQSSVVEAHHQNGTAENLNRQLKRITTCLLNTANLPNKFWEYALLHAVRIYNVTLHSSSNPVAPELQNTSPYERWYQQKPKVGHFRVFGCRVQAFIPHSKRADKFSARSIAGIYLGHPYRQSGVLVYALHTGQVFVSESVHCYEDKLGLSNDLADLSAQQTTSMTGTFHPEDIAEDSDITQCCAPRSFPEVPLPVRFAAQHPPEVGVGLDETDPIPEPISVEPISDLSVEQPVESLPMHEEPLENELPPFAQPELYSPTVEAESTSGEQSSTAVEPLQPLPADIPEEEHTSVPPLEDTHPSVEEPARRRQWPTISSPFGPQSSTSYRAPVKFNAAAMGIENPVDYPAPEVLAPDINDHDHEEPEENPDINQSEMINTLVTDPDEITSVEIANDEPAVIHPEDPPRASPANNFGIDFSTFEADRQPVKPIRRQPRRPPPRQVRSSSSRGVDNDHENHKGVYVTRSNRQVKLPQRYRDEYIYFTSTASVIQDYPMEPKTLKAARASNEAEEWEKAAINEIKAILNSNTYDLVDEPLHRRVVSTRWVFKRKFDDKGILIKHKARVVARGFEEEFGEDFNATFAPTVRFESVRLFISYAASLGLPIYQMDINSAFLNGDLEEEVYVSAPEGFGVPGKVWKLKKALYGLKQAPKAWHVTISTFLKSIGLRNVATDYGIFVKRTKTNKFVALCLFVDDIALYGHPDLVKEVKHKLSVRFKLKDMGLLNYFLGMSVNQNFQEKVTTIDQTAYIKTMLKKFDLEDVIPSSSPMPYGYDPDKDMEDENLNQTADNTFFRSMLGALQYLAQCKRPDILFSVNTLSRFSTTAKQHHLIALIRVLRYVKSTAHYSLKYEHEPHEFMMFTDASYHASNGLTYAGYVGMVNMAPIYWSTKKHPVPATSTAAAEYYGACYGVKQLFFHDSLGSLLSGSEQLYFDMFVDNKALWHFLCGDGHYELVKNFPKEALFTKWYADHEFFKTHYVSTTMNVADLMTKSLNRVALEHFTKMLRLN